jgi:hypothetical protein
MIDKPGSFGAVADANSEEETQIEHTDGRVVN